MSNQNISPEGILSSPEELLKYKPNVKINSVNDMNEWHTTPNSQYYLRIGDVQFLIPPTAIQVDKSSPSDRIPILRSNGSIKAKTGHQVTTLTVSVFFHSLQSINGIPKDNLLYNEDVDNETKQKKYYYVDGLRALIAQFEKCPFLPIENEYINTTLGIDAVTLSSLDVETVPGFPNTLKAKITMYQFNYRSYIPWVDEIVGEKENNILTFKHLFNWPLFRYYYQKNINNDTLINGRIMTDNISFKKPDQNVLDNRKTARTELKENEDYYDISLDDLLKQQGVSDGYLNQDKNKLFTALEQFRIVQRQKEKAEELLEEEISYTRALQMAKADGKVLGYINPEGSITLSPETDLIQKKAFELGLKFNSSIKSIIIFPEGHPQHSDTHAKFIDYITNLESNSHEKVNEVIKEFQKRQQKKEELETNANLTEEDLDMIDVELPDLNLEYLAVRMENVVTHLQLQQQSEPAHQYFGSQDILGHAEFTTTNQATVTSLRRMLDETNENMQYYRDEIMSGFLKVKNDLLKVFGVNTIVIDKCTIQTTDNPELYRIVMTFMQFDPKQKKRESLRGVNGVPEDLPSRDDLERSGLNQIKNMILLQKQLKNISPYPDLDLPKWQEIKQVIDVYNNKRSYKLGEVNNIDSTFVDPDFYIMSSPEISDFIISALDTDGTDNLKDRHGYSAEVSLPNKKETGGFIVNEKFMTDAKRLKKVITEADEGDENYYIQTQDAISFNNVNDNKYEIKNKIFDQENHVKISDGDVPSAQERFYSMFHDTIKYGHQGRLLRAFPAFHVFIIDEGLNFGHYKLWDNLYGTNGIKSIDLVRSRKNAADTLILNISNLYGNIYNKPNEEEEIEYEYSFVNYWTDSLDYSMIGNRKVLENRLNIKTGARITLRIGYGGDLNSLPLVFNGTITELNAEQQITMIAQSDGLELTNIIPAGEETTNTIFSYGNEPHNIIMEMLTNEGSWVNEIKSIASKGSWSIDSWLGIKHFGRTRYDSAWKFIRNKEEIGMNVYPATGSPDKDSEYAIALWAWICGLWPGNSGNHEEPNMQFYLYNQTPWDIFQKLSYAVADYIVSAQPFELRSTLFYGQPTWPFIYQYGYDGDWNEIEITDDINPDLITTKSKAFQQAFYIDSNLDIINNGIKASSRDVYTKAVASYKDDPAFDTEGVKEFDSMYVHADTDIDPKYQRLMRFDTGMFHKGILPYFSTKYIAEMMAANALRDSLKDMYKGPLTVLGMPSIKPHDYIHLNDTYNIMNGPILVEQVVHHIGADTGFITTITPDALATTSNSNIKPYTWLGVVSSAVSARVTLASIHAVLRVKDAENVLQFVTKSAKGTIKKLKNSSTTGLLKRLGSKIGNQISNASNLTRAQLDDIIRITYADELFKAYDKGSDVWNIATDLKKGSISISEALTDIAKITDGADDTASGLKKLLRAGEIIRNSFHKSTKALDSAADMTKAAGGIVSSIKGVATAGKILGTISTFAVLILVEGLQDYFFRWARNRQRCLIFPLKKDGEEFTAGIDGHQGLVWGDSMSVWDRMTKMTGMAMALPPLFNFKAWGQDWYSPGNTEDDGIDPFLSMMRGTTDIKMEDSTSGLPLPTDKNIEIGRTQEYMANVGEQQRLDTEDGRSDLFDYQNISDTGFFNFDNREESMLTPRMCGLLQELETELKNLGFRSRNIFAGRTSNKLSNNLEVKWESLTRVIDVKLSEPTAYAYEYAPHQIGMAVDIEYKSETERDMIIEAARTVGFGAGQGSLGYNKHQKYVHIDCIPFGVNKHDGAAGILEIYISDFTNPYIESRN